MGRLANSPPGTLSFKTELFTEASRNRDRTHYLANGADLVSWQLAELRGHENLKHEIVSHFILVAEVST